MKGESMKYGSVATRMGLIAAAMVFLFTVTTAASVEAKQYNLRTQLQKNNISMKIVRLERTDGFMFGLSFKGPNSTVVLAPGFNGMWLAQVGDDEIIMQRDASGKLQIISADGNDITLVLCYVQAVVTFLSDLTLCEQDPACLLISIIDLVTNVVTCSGPAVPTY